MAFRISSAPFFERCLQRYLITLPSMKGMLFLKMNSVGWIGMS
jgi:hypothetical protein